MIEDDFGVRGLGSGFRGGRGRELVNLSGTSGWMGQTQVHGEPKSQKLTLRSSTARLATNFPSLGLLFALSFVYSSLPKTVLSEMEYCAAHFGSCPSRAANRAAVVKVSSEEVRRGICSLSYQSA